MGIIYLKKAMQSTMAVNRLQMEIKMLKQGKAKGQNDLFEAYPKSEDNLMEWEAIIKGPQDCPYEGGQWKLSMKFTNDYPQEPPKCMFITPIIHVNVGSYICLDILQDQWSPAIRIDGLLTSLISLLTDPNPKSPLNGALGK